SSTARRRSTPSSPRKSRAARRCSTRSNSSARCDPHLPSHDRTEPGAAMPQIDRRELMNSVAAFRKGFFKFLEIIVVLNVVALALVVTIGFVSRLAGSPFSWYDEVASVGL